jgi:hypothetical protein
LRFGFSPSLGMSRQEEPAESGRTTDGSERWMAMDKGLEVVVALGDVGKTLLEC